MIILEDLCISYNKLEVIKALNLAIPSGTIHGLVGLNGSGKTTLLSSLFGLKQIDSGVINFNGLPLTRKDIGYLETVNYFYSRTTGREYLKLFCISNEAFDIEKWNALFNLPLDNYIESYSTGMKKKLAFMGVVALDTPVFLLDEPFNGIDLETLQKFKLIILALREKGKTVIITSHILESLTAICDAISYLNEKRIQATFDKTSYSEMEAFIFTNFNEENNQRIKEILK